MRHNFTKFWSWAGGSFDRQEQKPLSRDWLSWKLRWWWISAVCLVEVGFICALATLTWLSRRNDGVVDVSVVPISSMSDFSIPHLGSSQLRWTFVPALVMALFLLAYGAIVTAMAVRQPFVELQHVPKDRRNITVTLMLDYMTYPLFYVWVIAMRNGHVVVGFAFLAQLVASVSLVSLSANVFRADTSTSVSAISMTFPQEFNVDLLNSRTDMQPALDIASAVHIHGATAPTWMAADYAFESFRPVEEGISGNFTAKTFALSSSPDCRLMDPSEYSAVFEPSDEEGVGSTTITMVDRGCDVWGNIAFSPQTPIYALSWYQRCSDEPYDRIGIFAGLYSSESPGNLQNLTVVSCRPKYWNSTVSLTMSMDSSNSSAPSFSSAQEESVVELDPLSMSDIHRFLHYYIFYDPSATFMADIFGKTVYKFARIINPLSNLDPHSIKSAAESIYATMFAALATTSLKQPRRIPTVAHGQVRTVVTRLYVVESVAWVLMAILLAMLLCTASSLISVRTTTSILREEPKGLLFYARLLHRSDVLSLINDFDQRHAPEDKARDYMKRHYSAFIANARCYFDEQEARIRIEGGWLELGRLPKLRLRQMNWIKGKVISMGKWRHAIAKKINGSGLSSRRKVQTSFTMRPQGAYPES
ncbi:hypothetical protein CLAIMM_09622 [Cladophialophora immunda]|nr:hypothetical protein CLAIMM_09622 [Cladophialophora immunda]